MISYNDRQKLANASLKTAYPNLSANPERIEQCLEDLKEAEKTIQLLVEQLTAIMPHCYCLLQEKKPVINIVKSKGQPLLYESVEPYREVESYYNNEDEEEYEIIEEPSLPVEVESKVDYPFSEKLQILIKEEQELFSKYLNDKNTYRKELESKREDIHFYYAFRNLEECIFTKTYLKGNSFRKTKRIASIIKDNEVKKYFFIDTAIYTYLGLKSLFKKGVFYTSKELTIIKDKLQHMFERKEITEQAFFKHNEIITFAKYYTA